MAESFGENGEKDERKVRENERKREKGMWWLSQMKLVRLNEVGV